MCVVVWLQVGGPQIVVVPNAVVVLLLNGFAVETAGKITKIANNTPTSKHAITISNTLGCFSFSTP